jgi:sec-independent protein translocase protein TatA
MPNIGPMEIGIVLIIALIVFGPKKLPDLGHSLGKGLREFKGSLTGDDETPAPPQVTQAAPAVPVTQVTREHEKTPVA